MAPSPTGEYHIGHIRTVLYNWAFAKKHKGKFIIRIEDTDRERYVEGAVERILEVIKLYGLDWDEGPSKGGDFGPYIQSERLEIYKEHANKLIESGDGYYCFCTKGRLDSLRRSQRESGAAITKYDKHCLRLSKKEVKAKLESETPYVIRLNVRSGEEISFYDEVYGEIIVRSEDIDDQVLIKSDGFPTYHMAVVVDDHLMEISHILRGMDWIPSTPKHILLYKAFGWNPPTYAHLPNIKELGEGKKLSKRYGSVFALDFLQEGYLADAVLNFLMFLGWNPGTEKEIYSLEEFINDFSLDNVNKTDLVSFDRQKLLWMNGYYIRNMSSADLLQKIKEWAAYFSIDLVGTDYPNEYSIKVLDQIKERMRLLKDFNDLASYYFKIPDVPPELLTKYTKGRARAISILKDFKSHYEQISDWDSNNLEVRSRELLKAEEYSPKEAFMTLRVAVTGQDATPPLFDILELIGKKDTIVRLDKAIKSL